jgi:pre-mRNA-splicing factor CWC22
LLENPSDDNVEVAIRFVIECGSMLQDVSPEVLSDVLVHFRVILYLGRIDKSDQFMIKKLFAIRKAKFQGYPAVRPELDLVEVKEDMLTHDVLLDEEIDPEFLLDVCKIDPYFEMNEKLYEWEKKVLMGDDEESEEDQESGSDVESDEDNESMQIKVSKSDSRSTHSSDSANSDESGRNRKRKL